MAYPAGSVLTLVTWFQQEDRHWYGAQIPGRIKSIEFVQVKTGAGNGTSYDYQDYEGTPLAKMPDKDEATLTVRVGSILGQKASVMP